MTELGTTRPIAFQLAAGVCAALFAFAFVAAPHSCEWGLSAYFWSGVACLVLLFSTPFVLRRDAPAGRRVGIAFVFAGAVCASWIAGLFVANVRIMCRLF